MLIGSIEFEKVSSEFQFHLKHFIAELIAANLDRKRKTPLIFRLIVSSNSSLMNHFIQHYGLPRCIKLGTLNETETLPLPEKIREASLRCFQSRGSLNINLNAAPNSGPVLEETLSLDIEAAPASACYVNGHSAVSAKIPSHQELWNLSNGVIREI